jgi:hypothetical protein
MVGPLTRVNAQIINPGNAGNNAIWADSTHISPSTAYIDADVFATANGGPGGSDLCAILNYIYTNSIIPAGGAVIDARGIAVGQTRPCTVNPWNAVSNPPPTTVLLPSGGIFLEAQWTVPSGTHLIGERRNTNIGIYTTNSIGSGYMIQMGPLAPCSCPAAGCAPVVLEQIVLQPNVSVSTNVSGIDNECSGPLSYLDHIAFFDLAGVGVKVGAGAAGSGPYTDLSYTAGDFCKTQGSGVSCPSQCVNLQAPTRGVHGITCTMKSDITTNRADEAAIIVDGQNSIEDIHIEGFYDGVLLGNTSAAAGSTLLHLTSGNGGLSSGPVLNTVHICNPASPAAGSACTSYSSTDPGDITISDVTNNTGSALLIKDDVTSTNVGVPPGSAIEYVTGLYVLGESVAGGYSRFSTTPATTPAPGTPTWGVANLGSTLPSTPCPAGSVFSNTGGSTKANTVYVCEFSGSSTVWNAVN